MPSSGFATIQILKGLGKLVLRLAIAEAAVNSGRHGLLPATRGLVDDLAASARMLGRRALSPDRLP